MTKFGPLFRATRESKGKRLGPTASYIGVTVGFLSGVEVGDKAPLTFERIMKAAEFLVVDPRELLAAAAEDRGQTTLDTPDEKRREVGVSLQRGWSDLTNEQLEEIRQVVEKGKG